MSCVTQYESLSTRIENISKIWHSPCTHSECTLHQLAPYIGKLKSSIARYLLTEHTQPDDLVVDPFCGSGTILLEASLMGRRAYGADVNPYAQVLTKAKLSAPLSLKEALLVCASLIEASKGSSDLDNLSAPDWVQKFFHPKTLNEILAFTKVCRREGEWFFLA